MARCELAKLMCDGDASALCIVQILAEAQVVKDTVRWNDLYQRACTQGTAQDQVAARLEQLGM